MIYCLVKNNNALNNTNRRNQKTAIFIFYEFLYIGAGNVICKAFFHCNTFCWRFLHRQNRTVLVLQNWAANNNKVGINISRMTKNDIHIFHCHCCYTEVNNTAFVHDIQIVIWINIYFICTIIILSGCDKSVKIFLKSSRNMRRIFILLQQVETRHRDVRDRL